MTSKSKRLVDLARKFAERAASVDEHVDSLIMRGTFASAQEQAGGLLYTMTRLPHFDLSRSMIRKSQEMLARRKGSIPLAASL